MPNKNFNIAFLSNKYDVPEVELRQILRSVGIITKKRLKYIPSHNLKKTEELIVKHFQFYEEQPTPKSENILEVISPVLEIEKSKKKTKTKDDEWFIIGRTEEKIVYLTATDVKDIHEILVEDFKKSKDPIDPPGVKNEDLLESAVFRPKTSLGSVNKYPTIAMAGAALLHAIIHNHPFHNGNKRTALVSLIVFLDKNGWLLTIDQNTIYDFLIKLSAHQLVHQKTKELGKNADSEMLYIAQWLRDNIRTAKKGEYPLPFKVLREILTRFGCQFEQSRSGGLGMKISCGHLQTTIKYGGDGREIPGQTIHKVRRDLGLLEEHGCDSDIFYNKGPRIPDFIVKYRKVLDQLAKV